MTSTTDASGRTLAPERGYLDAAGPLIQPRELVQHLPDLRAGNVTTVLATVAAVEDSRYTMGVLAAWLQLERSATLPFRITRTVAEIDAATAVGDLAVVLHFQGGDPLDNDLNLLDAYHALGVRVIQPTYNARNRLGDGCLERANSGLSKFGKAAVARMNELGIVVDVAHVGIRTSLETIVASEAPVIVSHGNARAVTESRRNLNDEQIAAVAESGGVIGVCAFPAFVAPEAPDLERLLDHVDYLVEMVGDAHVGLGLDFSTEEASDYDYYGYEEDTYPRPPWIYPRGIRGFADERDIADGLRRRGYTEEQINGIARENFLGVFERVWGQ
ncbi:MAG TPA: membrane dipeptidase [Acidimicrobiales bacterium]|nr:membrane dipeptidase [Acidimicrobiales bacterium]